MKTMALLFLLAASTLVASAQSTNRNQPAPPVTICDARVTEYSATFKGNSAPQHPYHDRFNGPETRRHYGEGGVTSGAVDFASEPEGYTENEREFLAHMEGRKPPAATFPATIRFRATVKNTGNKPIKRLTFQLALSVPATGITYPAYAQPVKVKINPGEEVWFISTVSIRKTPGDLVRAMLSGRVDSDVRLLRIEYADGSTWDHP